MNNYESVFDQYIETHQLTNKTFQIDDFVKNVGYINFFNDITAQCLGKVDRSERTPTKTTGALVYLPDSAKDKLIQHFDVVYVTQLYYGVLTSGKMKFNYPNFEQFLKDLVALRLELKKKYSTEKNEYDALKNTLIKVYMNIVYGMLDKPESMVVSGLENPREYVVEISKKVMLSLVSFFLNKSMPVYYVDTDEIYVPHMNQSTFVDLEAYFRKECEQYINIDISTVVIDDNEKDMSAYIFAKKKMIKSPYDKTKVCGVDVVSDETTLSQNKKYFGRNHKDIFPEYAFWG